jgi:hypothetical protein
MTSGVIDEGTDSPIKKLLKFQGSGIWSGDLAEMRRDSQPSVTHCENDDSGRPAPDDSPAKKQPG